MDLKKLTPVLISLVFIPGIILAQQTRTKNKGDSTENESAFMSGSRIIPISQMDQSKIYNWGNGQRSTPTGRQADDASAKYARVFGDSAVVVRKYKKRNSTENKNAFMSGSRIIPISQMDQSKIYNWGNGQRSTPTGRQADDASAKYARVFGDSAVVVRKYGKKH